MIRLIKPTHADINAHFSQMKPAFDGAPLPKAEFDEMCQAVKDRAASFYQLSAKNGCARFVGVAKGETYHVWAMTGRGLSEVMPAFLDKVKACGFARVTVHCYKRAMVRMLKSLGYHVTETTENQGVSETVLTYELRG